MSGDRRVFDEAMQAGAGAAWDRDWDQAVAAYQQALAEFPADITALAGLGLAYVGAGHLEAALEAYRQASELSPDDPVLCEHIGRVLEQLGQGREAAQAYVEAAERYTAQRQAPDLAVERWRDAVRVFPECIEAHARLLRYHHRQGQVREAVNECLILARIYQGLGQPERAVKACDYALSLAPHDADVLAALDELRFSAPTAGSSEARVSQEDLEPLAAIEEAQGAAVLDLPIAPVAGLDEERGSPLDLTRQKALADLAESFFEEGSADSSRATARLSKAKIDILIGRAVDFQARGKVEEAIGAYERVVGSGLDWPAVHFNLGLLYQEKARFDDAIPQFEWALSHADYALGGHFALGECYRALGRIDEALDHFVEVLKIVDLATVRPERADDLSLRYDGLVSDVFADGGREQASEFITSLVEFLGERGWEGRVVQARQRLDRLTGEGTTVSLAEMLALPDSERILESVAMAQDYAERGAPYAALEEVYFALGLAPTYLPIHQQVAQVLIAMGKVEDAVSKLLVIGDTYHMRGDVRPAMVMYRRALDLAPMDTAVRARFIELLVTHGEIDEALEHYLILADSYQHLAQIDQAQEIYEEALQLAPRGSSNRGWEVQILHRLGDIYMQRVDWKHAIGVYERICKLVPTDERARSALMDLYYRVNRPDLAIVELDSLLKTYRENDRPERILGVLEDAVREWPDSLPLRTRLAQVHLDAGDAQQALKHLDKLGDLQLEAGRYEDARATIRAIIALRPPNVADYQQLLDQLSEHDSS